jgi:hypothetical protein
LGLGKTQPWFDEYAIQQFMLGHLGKLSRLEGSSASCSLGLKGWSKIFFALARHPRLMINIRLSAEIGT